MTLAGGGASAAASTRPLQPPSISANDVEARRRPIPRLLFFIRTPHSPQATIDTCPKLRRARPLFCWAKSAQQDTLFKLASASVGRLKESAGTASHRTECHAESGSARGGQAEQRRSRNQIRNAAPFLLRPHRCLRIGKSHSSARTRT